MIAKHYSCCNITVKALLGMCMCVYMFEYGVLALMDLCVYTYACWGVYMDVEAKDFECLLPNLLLDLEFPTLA